MCRPVDSSGALGGNVGHILNVGFGKGLVDIVAQRYSTLSYTTNEAHPNMYDRMIRIGWMEKLYVKVIFWHMIFLIKETIKLLPSFTDVIDSLETLINILYGCQSTGHW